MRFPFHPLALALLLWAFCLMGHAKERDKDPFDDQVPGLAEVLAEQARELGSAIDQRNRLKAERLQAIQSLEQRLAACKGCADKAQIETELARWRQTDRIVREAERGALVTMGLPQYRDLDELGMGMLKGLAQAGEQIEAQRRRQAELGQLSQMVRHACEAEHQPERPAHCKNPMPPAVRQAFNQQVVACVKQNDPLQLYAKDLMVRDMCKRHHDPSACTQANSPLERAKTYNRATALKDMELRRQRKAQAQAEWEAALEAKNAERLAQRAERKAPRCRGPECAEQRRNQVNERNAQRREEAEERRRQRLECEQA